MVSHAWIAGEDRTHKQRAIEDRTVNLHTDGRTDAILLVELGERGNDLARIVFRTDDGWSVEELKILQEHTVRLDGCQ